MLRGRRRTDPSHTLYNITTAQQTSIAKLDILAVLTRYLVDPNVPNDEHADRVEVYYDFACGLAPVVLNRAPGLAQRIDFKHDR